MAGFNLKNTAVVTWIWIFLIVGFILVAGGFTFYVVSDKGMPSWDYRPVKSLPSESPHAEYEKLPFPQHIRGKGGQ
ncbi:MAG: hypothetical protein MJE63_00085 [Proteobacteria bacterium]|nr:hypothetical protein [Pseudomonadota bacterium]